MPPGCEPDHLVVIAPTLAEGAAQVGTFLGVPLQPGGEHARMGTHNMLLSLGNAIYLEVLAVNPKAPRPERPRWFELDRLPPDGAPRLATWVARTADIHGTAARASLPLGAIESMSRGDLQWLITIPEDRRMPLGGVVPALIEWRSGTHPARRLESSGCSLTHLTLRHPEPERVTSILESIDLRGPVSVLPGEKPRLVAEIQTPSGTRELS